MENETPLTPNEKDALIERALETEGGRVALAASMANPINNRSLSEETRIEKRGQFRETLLTVDNPKPRQNIVLQGSETKGSGRDAIAGTPHPGMDDEMVRSAWRHAEAGGNDRPASQFEVIKSNSQPDDSGLSEHWTKAIGARPSASGGIAGLRLDMRPSRSKSSLYAGNSRRSCGTSNDVKIRSEGTISRKPTRETIHDMYVNRGMNDAMIAEHLGLTYDKVFYLRNKKFGIKGIRRKNTFKDIKDTPLTDIQKSIVVGSLFGDACIGVNRQKNCFYLCEQTNKRYVEFKKAVMGDLIQMPAKFRSPQGYCKTGSWRFSSITHPYFMGLRDEFYGRKGKRIPEGIMQNLTPAMLAIWFFDDGTNTTSKHKNHQHVNQYLYTCAYSLDDNKLIRKHLYRLFGIKTSILVRREGSKKHYFLYFAKATNGRLMDILREYLAGGMQYKLGSSETTREPSPYWGNDIVPSPQ